MTEKHRGGHLVRHLGDRVAIHLTLEDVDGYRRLRSLEQTIRKNSKGEHSAPSVASINREVALLRRMLNWGVEAKVLPENPLEKVPLVEEDNVRRVVVDEAAFVILVEKADGHLKPILLVAYDTGMRRAEISSSVGHRWT